MGYYEFPGDRPPQSADLGMGGQLPAHLRPPKDQCVVHPVRSVFVCTEKGREEHVIPGQVRCSCGGDHSQDNPCDQPIEMNEYAELIEGWTVQAPFRRTV